MTTEISIQPNLKIKNKLEKIQKKKAKTKSEFIKTSKLLAFDIIEMYNIYVPYHNVNFEDFYKRTLLQFNVIAVHRDKISKKIIGFCGIRQDVLKIQGKKMDVYYYGQMFILEAYRGCNLIQKTSAPAFFKNKIFHPFRPLYYWGDCISYKSYLLLAKYYPTIYPRAGFNIPPHEQAVRDFIGKKYYPDSYREISGIILKDFNRLKEETAKLSEEDLVDPNIKFYTETNPGYYKGDGLLTIIPGTYSNFIANIKIYLKKKKIHKNNSVKKRELIHLPN